MKKDVKFTPAMIALAQQQYNNGALTAVDGILPSTTVQPGFRYLN
jgi:hypothetical protein